MIKCDYFGKCGGCFYIDSNEQNYQSSQQELLNSINHTQIAPEWIWVGPNSRRKVTLQLSATNKLGFFKEKSKEIIEITRCPIATKNISDFLPKLQQLLQKLPHKVIKQISITEFDNCLSLILYLIKDLEFTQNQKVINFAQETNCNISIHKDRQTSPLINLQSNQININNHTLKLSPDIFIQATQIGLDKIVNIITNEIKDRSDINNVADIYSGFGIYSFAISKITKNISCFEGSADMTNLTKKNVKLNSITNILANRRDVFQQPLERRLLNRYDLALINPPRNGATPQVKEIARSELKNLIYVSCNPKTFFEDTKILIDAGFKIKKLYALDQFYLTKHLEVIGVFTR